MFINSRKRKTNLWGEEVGKKTRKEKYQKWCEALMENAGAKRDQSSHNKGRICVYLWEICLGAPSLGWLQRGESNLVQLGRRC